MAAPELSSSMRRSDISICRDLDTKHRSHSVLTREVVLCRDMGHFAPTETSHDKILSLLVFHKELLLHVSRPLHWDRDHVVILNGNLC